MITKIEISIARQELVGWYRDRECCRYSISSALLGAGNESGSNKTPLGLHKVRALIGADLPNGAVFVGRRFTGEVYSSQLAEHFPERDWILTRILWLSGCEPGLNRLGSVDSMRRFIYIHGTPDSEPMGVPASHGCIRMRNLDLLQLFPQVSKYCSVMIEA